MSVEKLVALDMSSQVLQNLCLQYFTMKVNHFITFHFTLQRGSGIGLPKTPVTQHELRFTGLQVTSSPIVLFMVFTFIHKRIMFVGS